VGKTHAEIIDDYPEIQEDDIRQCIEYAAWLASEKNVAIRKLTPSAIIFRLSDESHETVNFLLNDILPKVERELLKGAIVIIEADRYRIRELPVS